MTHFVHDDKMNVFRLPFGWQWLTNNNLGGSLYSTNFAKLDHLVTGCLNTGALCIIDVGHPHALAAHNY
jgi:endoglucanase